MSLGAKRQQAISGRRRYRRYHVPDEKILSVRPECRSHDQEPFEGEEPHGANY